MNRSTICYMAFFVGLLIWGCSKSDPSTQEDISDSVQELYFPPQGSDNWETVNPSELGWNENAATSYHHYYCQDFF